MRSASTNRTNRAISAALNDRRSTEAISAARSSAARVGNQTDAIWLQDILRQSKAEYPRAKLDEIGDSLVARAIDPTSVQQQSAAHTRAAEALMTLWRAGRARNASSSGRPYAGAFDRMVTVHRQAPSHYIRAKALSTMLTSASHLRAVDYLREVAESGDSTAYEAMVSLIFDADGVNWTTTPPTASERQESISALKALAARGRVTDGRAAKLLRVWISENPQ
jgi:hypothetical protein